MPKQTERYTNRDILIRVAEAQEQTLAFFSNDKFVDKLREGIKAQTIEIIKEIKVMQDTTKETRVVISWMRYTAFGIISALVGVDLALIGLYVRQILMSK